MIATLISWACAGCTAHYFWQFFHNPQFFLTINPWIDLPSKTWKSILGGAYILAVWIGTGYCVYKGMQATLDWMPKSWTVMPDDEPILVRDSLADTIAAMASILLITELANVAKRLVKAERVL